MKILMLAQESYLAPMGGLTVYMEEVCHHLQEMGNDVTWLGVDVEQQRPYDSREKGYRHVCCPNTLQTRPMTELFHQINLLEIYTYGLVTHLKDEQFDVIQINDSYMYRGAARVAQRMFNAPLVAGSHLSFTLNTDYDYAKQLPTVYQYEVQQELNCFHNAAATFTVSNPYADALQEALMLSERPEVVHNGVNLDPIDSAEPDYDKRREYAEDHERLFIFCGRMTEYKGVPLVMEAAKRNPKDKFLMISKVSPGIENLIPLVKEVEEQCKELPNLFWEGSMPFDEKWGLMKTADGLIVPSTNEEPFGIAALEAFGLNVDLITTATGGMADFCNDDNSVIIKPTADSLSEAIKGFSPSDERRDKARKVAEHLSWKRTSVQQEKILRKVVDEQQDILAHNVRVGGGHAHQACQG